MVDLFDLMSKLLDLSEEEFGVVNGGLLATDHMYNNILLISQYLNMRQLENKSSGIVTVFGGWSDVFFMKPIAEWHNNFYYCLIVYYTVSNL